ncbi:MAG: glycosyltransferase family 4 protein [Chloroflexi bacterium]|nr:glycosyltransferase family 4 protein [Chloroflexota bacterium]
MSGVPIAGWRDTSGEGQPQPDYAALAEALAPDILDASNLPDSPWVLPIRRHLGEAWAVGLAAALSARRYKAILAAGEDVGLPLAFWMRLLRRRTSLFMICHNVAGKRSRLLLQVLRLASVPRWFLCLSTAQERFLRLRYRIPEDRLQTIHWHVDHRFFSPVASPPSPGLICSAGMASRDYATLVGAVAGLPVQLKIAADSPWFRQALNIQPDAVPRNVEVRSYGTYAALRTLYAQSAFVVIPLEDISYAAGYTVVLEAMAMGNAVICTRTRQPDDFIVEGETGFYVPPGDIGALRDRIRYLLDHPNTAISIGLAGRRRVEAYFTIDHFVGRITNLLEAAGIRGDE